MQYPSVIRAKTLTEPRFYNFLIDRFVNDFENIKKINFLSTQNNVKMILDKDVKTPNELKNVLAIIAAKTYSNDVLAWFENQSFKNPTDKVRCKQLITKMLSDTQTTDNSNELLNELESKVRNLKNCKYLM